MGPCNSSNLCLFTLFLPTVSESKSKHSPSWFSIKQSHIIAPGRHIRLGLLDFSSGDSDLRTHQNSWSWCIWLTKSSLQPFAWITLSLSTFFQSWFRHSYILIALLFTQGPFAGCSGISWDLLWIFIPTSHIKQVIHNEMNSL